MILRTITMATVAASAILAATQGARADVVSFTLTTPNSALSGFPSPYTQVQVNRTSTTTATLTFTSLTNSGNIYLMGDGGSVAFNVNATSWTLGSVTGSNAGTGFTPGPYSDGGAGNEDGFGSFNQTINSFDGFTHSSDTIVVDITDTGGTWTTASQVLTPNAGDNAEAAAHIFVTASPANAANGALVTGFAAGNGGGGPPPPPPPPPAVPEPWSIGLLGVGLLGLGLVRRMQRR
jgi:hypothetical protein